MADARPPHSSPNLLRARRRTEAAMADYVHASSRRHARDPEGAVRRGHSPSPGASLRGTAPARAG
jgi:hypothetical protein